MNHLISICWKIDVTFVF